MYYTTNVYILLVVHQRAKMENINEEREIKLTAKQQEVLTYLAQGLQNKEIALKMDCSASTVKQHVSGIMLRLNINTRTAVVVTAKKLGLI